MEKPAEIFGCKANFLIDPSMASMDYQVTLSETNSSPLKIGRVPIGK